MKDHKNNSEESKKQIRNPQERPNLFQGRTEGEKGNAKFPEWNIVPPNQIINPRIKRS